MVVRTGCRIIGGLVADLCAGRSGKYAKGCIKPAIFICTEFGAKIGAIFGANGGHEGNGSWVVSGVGWPVWERNTRVGRMGVRRVE